MSTGEDIDGVTGSESPERGGLRKDFLVLAMLAALGGETREVNERDLFLACWHAYPSAMRWVDTALPNPDTFTAALRRLDAAGFIIRVGKQQRKARGRRKSGSSKRTVLDAGRSGVVRARVAPGALDRAAISPAAIDEARALAPSAHTYDRTSRARLVVTCIAARASAGRASDEGAIVETAFHKFPAVFAYKWRPEFPDTGVVREAIAEAQAAGWLTDTLSLTHVGAEAASSWGSEQLQIDRSEAPKVGSLKAAARIDSSVGYHEFAETGSLAATKADELFRLLRLPPTADPRPLAAALRIRAEELRRLDRGDLAQYLTLLAQKHNPDAFALLDGGLDDEKEGVR